MRRFERVILLYGFRKNFLLLTKLKVNSSSGHGETIAKFCLAHTIVKEMEYGKPTQVATKDALEKMTSRLQNTAGEFHYNSFRKTYIGSCLFSV